LVARFGRSHVKKALLISDSELERILYGKFDRLFQGIESLGWEVTFKKKYRDWNHEYEARTIDAIRQMW